jgi:hypothetical protein
MDIKGIIMDHVGHFAMPDIPALLFSVLVAAALGWVLAGPGAGRVGRQAREFALWSATAALAVGLVRAQLPLALALVALAMLVGAPAGSDGDRSLRAGALVLGLGCGSGAALVTVMAAVPYVLIVRWARAGRGAS